MNTKILPHPRAWRARVLALGSLMALVWTLAAPTASGQLLDTISDRVVAIDTKINTALNRLTSLQTSMATTLDQARTAVEQTDNLPEVVARIREVYDTVDGPGKQFIEDYVTMVRVLIDEQRAGYGEFITIDPQSGASPASAFRGRLAAFIAELEGLANDLIAADGRLAMEVRLTVIVRLVDALPDGMLYPFHVILDRELKVFDSGLPELIAQLRGALPVAQAFLEARAPGGARQASAAPSSDGARPAAYTSLAIQVNGQTLKSVGFVVGMVGKFIGAFDSAKETEGKIGIHGYVAVHAKINVLKIVASVIEIVGETCAHFGERVLGELDSDEALARHTALADGIDELKAGQADIAISHAQLLAGQELLLATLQRIDPGLFPAVATTPPAVAMEVSSGPGRVHVGAGDPVVFSAPPVTSPDATYQWRKDGVPIVGAVFASHAIRKVSAADTGAYDVLVTDGSGTQVSAAARVALIPARVLNFSVRFDIPDSGHLIAGFVIEDAKSVVVRGIGESLANYGVPLENTMPDPQIVVFDSAGQVVAANDNYERTAEADAVMAAVGAFPIVATTDAAMVASLPAGAYTVHISGKDLRGGDCLIEIYDTE